MALDFSLDRQVPLVVLTVVLLLLLAPFRPGRYAFFLDQAVGPAWDTFALRFFGLRTPAYGGSLPLFGVLAGVADLTGAGIAQTVLWVGILSITAASGYAYLPGSRSGRLYGALLLLVNPFVYTRLLVGHWAVIWGLAMLPLVLYTYTEFLRNPTPRALAASVIAITLLGFNVHLLYASSILLGAVTIFHYVDYRDRGVARGALAVGAVALPVNAYWLVPTLFGSGRSIASVSTADLSTFAPSGGRFSALYSTVTMHGFWRDAYVYARDLFLPVEALYVIVLFLAVYGFITSYDDDVRGHVVKALGVTAVVAVLLGAGVSGPAAPVFEWLFENAPFFAGMRDSNKFVALLVFAYAYLGALGVNRLLPEFDRLQWRSAVVLLLVILTPLAYTFPMVTGFAGQVSTQDYPEEWYEVDRMLESDPGNYNVLFLPWHQYMDYSWIEGRQQRIATPARDFFSKPVIQGDNVEVGPTYSTSENPVSAYVESLFGLGPGNRAPDVSNMGELLTYVNVKYVLLTKEADWREYETILRDQDDLRLVRENARFLVYENERPVHRAYAVDGATHVWDDESDARNVDATRVTDDTGGIATEGEDLHGVEPLKTTGQSPVRYRIEGTDRAYSIVVLSQVEAEAGGWRYDGDRAIGKHMGVQPAFVSDAGGGIVRYAPFYRLYLPSYILSVLSIVAVVWYGMGNHDRVTAARDRLLTSTDRREDDD